MLVSTSFVLSAVLNSAASPYASFRACVSVALVWRTCLVCSVADTLPAYNLQHATHREHVIAPPVFAAIVIDFGLKENLHVRLRILRHTSNLSRVYFSSTCFIGTLAVMHFGLYVLGSTRKQKQGLCECECPAGTSTTRHTSAWH